MAITERPRPPARIRTATVDDEAALRAVDLATWTSDVSPVPPPGPDRPFFGVDVPPADVRVAVVDDVVAGYVRIGYALPIESSLHVLEVKGLAVSPSHQGRGIGRLLLAAARELASERGARRLTLRVLGPNTAARALYASGGFVVEGTLRELFLLDGRYVDDVLMTLDLTST